MNQHIERALQIYKQYGEDFGDSLKWHLANGVVVCLPDCFMLAFFCNQKDIWKPLTLCKADCVHVTMCVGNMRQAVLQIVELVPWVAYEREFKGNNGVRIKNFKKLFNKL